MKAILRVLPLFCLLLLAPRPAETSTDDLPPAPTSVAAPTGMVYIPPGTAKVGTPFEELGALLQNRDRNFVELFFFEGPEHDVAMPGYYIDRFEVTNAQWLYYLQDAHAASYDTTEGELAHLGEVAGSLVNAQREQWNNNQIADWQLFGHNLDALAAAMPDKVVKSADGEIELLTTFAKMRRAPLPRGVTLHFYDMLPPQHWPSTRPAEEEMAHPVRWLSFNEVEAFCEWAGRHPPTEAEWEYACRGPQALRYPWGDEFPREKAKEILNWSSLYIDSQYKPTTVPVHDLAGGVSPAGLFHTVGNVQEWTSSWFDMYPGSQKDHEFMGEFAKVLRGGAADVAEKLAMRAAARNWKANAPDAPPRPENHFAFAGFRTALYPQPALSRMGPILRRALRGRYFTAEKVAMDHFAGAATYHFADALDENVVTTVGRSYAVVVVPLKTLLDEEDQKIRDQKRLFKESQGDDPLPLAILHTDVGLAKVFVPDLRVDPDATENTGRRRREAELKLVEGTIPAGTYLLALWKQRLVLVDPTLELVCYLNKGSIAEGKDAMVIVDKLDEDEFPATHLDVIDAADLVEVGFGLKMGGKRADEKVTIVVRGLLLNTAPGMLSAAGTWHVTPNTILPIPEEEVVWEVTEAEDPSATPNEPAPPAEPDEDADTDTDAGDDADMEGEDPDAPSEEAPDETPADETPTDEDGEDAPADVPEDAPDDDEGG